MSIQLRDQGPLFALLWDETEGRRFRLFLALVVSGFSNAAILALVNQASEASENGAGGRVFLLFLLAIFGYVYCQKYAFATNVRIFEGAIERFRLRLSNKIRHTELATFEGLGRSELYDAMTREMQLITQTASLLSGGIQVSTMGLFTAAYVAILSPVALVLIVVLMVIGLSIYRGKQQAASQYIQVATETEIAFVDIVGHSLDGFKEARLNARRSLDVHQELASRTEASKTVKIKITDLFAGNYIFFQAMFYLLLAAVAFILPRFISGYGEVVNEVSTAVLFVSGPLFLLSSSLQQIMEANFAAARIKALEEKLDELSQWTEEEAETLPPIPTSFRDIELVNLEYSYRSLDGGKLFTVGPTSLEIRSGELLFLVGGNGSGKSSLLYLLTALFAPDHGFIRLDGRRVGTNQVQEYRELFSTIFSDFHLFDKLYGLLGVDSERVRELLAQMQLDEKTDFVDDRFTSLDLSTGQRKRLALIVSLLDDRPIFVFDELAADQDPQFREYLYSELFPELKNKGKTIIAVSHDDRYFHLADRVFKMDYGKMVEYRD